MQQVERLHNETKKKHPCRSLVLFFLTHTHHSRSVPAEFLSEQTARRLHNLLIFPAAGSSKRHAQAESHTFTSLSECGIGWNPWSLCDEVKVSSPGDGTLASDVSLLVYYHQAFFSSLLAARHASNSALNASFSWPARLCATKNTFKATEAPFPCSPFTLNLTTHARAPPAHG